MNEIEKIIAQAVEEIAAAADLATVNAIRVAYLGKKGQLTQQLKQISQLPNNERPQAGQLLNQAKQRVTEQIKMRQQLLEAGELKKSLADAIDVTLPGRGQQQGSIHPVSRTTQRIEMILGRMGFVREEGPEIEDDAHNFELLNIPPHHPAREMQDTFYLPDGRLLRTHTSSVQIRIMEQSQPPFRIITLGRVYRCDFDATHTPMFHQTEALAVDEYVNFADLKGLLIEFMREFFQEDLATRFRPSYFPFTEPSAEMDISCVICHGKKRGCRVCKDSGWLEVLGCGMVHPNVLANVGIDSERYSGFAFGLGIDRMAMLRYGINDLRTLFDNNMRLLEQF
ncbi:MAG: phenylalanine--tRNA ligase subunit alpha [Gammaproteobacteria bacterium]|nr:phenylalanine--tRNA ligase subunit alpha [Gammaproteobacteria bacterium]